MLPAWSSASQLLLLSALSPPSSPAVFCFSALQCFSPHQRCVMGQRPSFPWPFPSEPFPLLFSPTGDVRLSFERYKLDFLLEIVLRLSWFPPKGISLSLCDLNNHFNYIWQIFVKWLN